MEKYSHQVTEITVSYKPVTQKCEPLLIQSSLDAYNIFKEIFPESTIYLQEQFVVLYLNRANQVIGSYTLSIGGLTGTVADLRLVLSVALKVAATGMIIAHNHPSGNIKPSKNDELLTSKLNDASTLMDIRLWDHVILSGTGCYFSFADEGCM